MKLYNTLTRQIEEFKPLRDKKVTFYHCGPTVYWTQHIGNLRGMMMGDLLRRTLEYLGYEVIHVRNYTDVGHLVSDGDTGEDKMAKAARRENLNPELIAQKYIDQFESDVQTLNMLDPVYKPRATQYIKPMQSMIAILLKKGYAYQTEWAIYFDVFKFKNYDRLSGQKLIEQTAGAGKGQVKDAQKRHNQDFALWFFKKGQHQNALQTWNSPWGEGFPGWHLECSVMSKELLGETIDIHMGGVEHIPVHHTNEIAQSEAANGVKFVNYWLHNEHLLLNGNKMAKSAGTGLILKEVLDKGYAAMDLRYLFLQAHYRSQQNFTWQTLEAAAQARQNLLNRLFMMKGAKKSGKVILEYKKRFTEAVCEDLNIPKALSVVWQLLDSAEQGSDIFATSLDFDRILGLQIGKSLAVSIPKEIITKAKDRQLARQKKQFNKADLLRQEIDRLGYIIEDLAQEFVIKPKRFA
jgi:cysteinyl-tRNA synthetase